MPKNPLVSGGAPSRGPPSHIAFDRAVFEVKRFDNGDGLTTRWRTFTGYTVFIDDVQCAASLKGWKVCFCFDRVWAVRVYALRFQTAHGIQGHFQKPAFWA